MSNEKKISEIKTILSGLKNNGQRLAMLNQLREDLIEEIALERGLDLETSKGLNLAQVHAMRKFPELFSQSLMDR